MNKSTSFVCLVLFICSCDQKPKEPTSQPITREIDRTDLPGMRQAGEIRVLLLKPEGAEVPREGATKAADTGQFELLAEALGTP